MKRIWMGFFAVILAVTITACGSGGGTTGNGATVSVTAGISNGTAGSVFGNLSTSTKGTTVFSANAMSITLTSVALSQSGTVPVSNVNIQSITMGLAAQPYSSTLGNPTNALSPTIAKPQYSNIPQGVGGIIPGPGILKIDGIDIFGLSDAAVLIPPFALNINKPNKVYYKYIATIAFNCVESNSGLKFTVYEPVGVEIEVK